MPKRSLFKQRGIESLSSRARTKAESSRDSFEILHRPTRDTPVGKVSTLFRSVSIDGDKKWYAVFYFFFFFFLRHGQRYLSVHGCELGFVTGYGCKL